MVVKKSQFEIMILILFMSSLIIITDSMVSMCQNVSIVATEFSLGRTKSDSANCACRLVSTNYMKNTVMVSNYPFDGCQYRLMVDFEGYISYHSCDTKRAWTSTLSMDTEILNFKLEPYKSTKDGAEFTMNITSSSDANLTLTCFIETLTTSTHLPSSTTQCTSSSTTLPSRISTTNELPVSETTLRQTEDFNVGLMRNEDHTVGIAVGCFIGGIVFGIIAVLGLQWFRLKRQKKDEIYSTPTNTNIEDHTYVSIIPGSGVGNINTTGETTHTSSSTVSEVTVAPNSTRENSTSNPSVTYHNESNNPYLTVI